jgi:hypothetical protein
MVSEKARRRAEFQAGTGIKMADGQEWLFSSPPPPGTDAEYDGLVEGLLEAEDQNDARKSELAIAMFLLSRNYQPTPREYEEIFSFRTQDATRSSAQEAISGLISADLDRRRRHSALERSSSAALRHPMRSLPALISSCAMHLRSSMAPWLH